MATVVLFEIKLIKTENIEKTEHDKMPRISLKHSSEARHYFL